MIVAVTEQFHNYKPRSYFVDTDKLNPEGNGVDAALLEVANQPGATGTVTIDGTKYLEAAVSLCAVVEKGPSQKSIDLIIDFKGNEKPKDNESQS